MLNLSPSLLLSNKVDNYFTLVMIIAKRARQITDMPDKLSNIDNPIIQSIKEFNENKLIYIRTKSGIK
jgi:DNA-directed RNA polymerase subunit omega